MKKNLSCAWIILMSCVAMFGPQYPVEICLNRVYKNIKFLLSYQSADLYNESVYLASWQETLYYFRWVWYFHLTLLVLRCRWTSWCLGLWSARNGGHWMIAWASDTWCVPSRSDTRHGTQTTPKKHIRLDSHLQTIRISGVEEGAVRQLLPNSPYGLSSFKSITGKASWFYRRVDILNVLIPCPKGAQIRGARSSRRIHFVQWRLMYVAPKYVTCFMWSFWRLEFRGHSYVFEKLCTRLTTTPLDSFFMHLFLPFLFLSQSGLMLQDYKD